MMRGDIEKSAHASHKAEARAKLRSRFELFSQPLPTEAELFAMWGDSDEVVASITRATFEQGKIPDDAIGSFLRQKFNFPLKRVTRQGHRRWSRHVDLTFFDVHLEQQTRLERVFCSLCVPAEGRAKVNCDGPA